MDCACYTGCVGVCVHTYLTIKVKELEYEILRRGTSERFKQGKETGKMMHLCYLNIFAIKNKNAQTIT